MPVTILLERAESQFHELNDCVVFVSLTVADVVMEIPFQVVFILVHCLDLSMWRVGTAGLQA